MLTKTLNTKVGTSEAVYDDLFEKAKENGKKFLEELGELLDEHLDGEGDQDGKPMQAKQKTQTATL